MTSKFACAALLIAVSLEARTAPTPSQGQPKPSSSGTLRPEQPYGEAAVKKLRDLGYFDAKQFKLRADAPTRCAIPLLTIPVPAEARFSIKTVPANPSIDPKMISPPPLPACPQTAVLPTIKPPEPAADKK